MESESLPVVKPPRKLRIHLGVFAFVLVFVGFAVSVIMLFWQLQEVKQQLQAISSRAQNKPQVMEANEEIPLDLSAYATLSDITLLEERLAKQIVENNQTESSLVTTQTVVQEEDNTPQVTYIQIPGEFSTTSLNWVDVSGSDVYIDKYNDYGDSATISWEAFIHTEHGNGETHVRLYDVTHNIGVDRSEISSNSSVTKLVLSQSLPLWKGNNLYRIQVKSQSGFSSYFDSGRIKVSQ